MGKPLPSQSQPLVHFWSNLLEKFALYNQLHAFFLPAPRSFTAPKIWKPEGYWNVLIFVGVLIHNNTCLAIAVYSAQLLELMRITMDSRSSRRHFWKALKLRSKKCNSPYCQMDCFKTEHCRQPCSYIQKSLFWVLIWSILHRSRIRCNILRVFKCRRYLNCRTFLWAICDP